MDNLKAFVNFSGGLGSWAASKLAVEQYGRENVTLVFSDTLIEDDDLYRFLPQAVANVFGWAASEKLRLISENIPSVDDMTERKYRLATLRATTMEHFYHQSKHHIVWLADGRTPFEIYRDERFLGNSRVDPCSKILKRELLDKWFDANCPRPTTRRVVGLGQWERHRFEGDGKKKRGLRSALAERGWTCEAPLIYASPEIGRYDLPKWAEREGLTPTRAYDDGFSHDNCGAQCCKGGQEHWLRVYRHRRDRFDNAERQENGLREMLGDVSMMKETKRGVKFPLPLTEFRRRIEAGDEIPLFPSPPCACFAGDE